MYTLISRTLISLISTNLFLKKTVTSCFRIFAFSFFEKLGEEMANSFVKVANFLYLCGGLLKKSFGTKRDRYNYS
jgi:hypothetical protein